MHSSEPGELQAAGAAGNASGGGEGAACDATEGSVQKLSLPTVGSEGKKEGGALMLILVVSARDD